MKGEIPRLLRLALPMMVAQGGLMTMGLVDTFMIGRISALDMGAVALGNGIFGVLIVLGIGAAMGIEPLAAQAHGAGETDRANHWLWQGIWLSALLAPALMLLLLLSTMAFEPIGVEAAIATRTTAYLWSRAPGVPFNCIYGAYRAYLTSIGRTRPIVIAVVSANVLNVILDYVLLFVFDLGAVGLGLGTSACWVLMLVVAAAGVDHASTERGPRSADLRRIVSLGLPIGLQLAVEVGIFAMVSTLIARMGAVPLAGHQIAISVASATFMCAVGLAVASTARVGYHIGAGRSQDARHTGFISIIIGGGFMGVTGLGLLVFAGPIAGAFAPADADAAAVGAALLRIAAVFSVSDGVQVVAAGALRGAGDTKWPFAANSIAHWLVGLPVGLWLGYQLDMGAAGFWWGLTAGLTGVAVILTLRFAVLSSRPLTRVEASAP